jgi:hypothetical protein
MDFVDEYEDGCEVGKVACSNKVSVENAEDAEGGDDGDLPMRRKIFMADGCAADGGARCVERS